ncbi:MAG: DUF2059 domain-containing protein [Marinobacter sp.]
MQHAYSRVTAPTTAVFILAGSLLAMILAPAARASALAESVVSLSPLGTIAEQSRLLLKDGIRDGLVGTGQVDPIVAETIAAIGSGAFDPQRIQARLVTDLDDDLDSAELETVEQWYQSDLGQRIARAETEAAMPDAWKAVRESAPALRERYEGSRRQELFARYDRATRASERTVETAMAVQMTLAEAVASLSEKHTADSVRAQVQEHRPAIERHVREQLYLAYLYMYEDFQDQELETYLDFLESAEGRAFTASAGTSLHDSILGPVSSVGSQLVRLLDTGGR